MERTEDLPGLFSKNSEWPRASDYKLVMENNRLYISPTENSVIQYYSPFECYPDILEAFFKMCKKLTNINDDFNNWLKNNPDCSPQYADEEIIKRDNKKGRAIIRFSRRYGLFGLFFEFIRDIEEWPVYQAGSVPNHEWKLLVTMTRHGAAVVRDSRLRDINFESSNTEYDIYAKRFFPRLHAPYPVPAMVDGNGSKFWAKYSERVEWIAMECTAFYKAFLRWQNWLQAQKSGATPDDIIDPKWPELKWKHEVNFSVHSIGITPEFDDRGHGSWQQRYLFKSLLSAMKIMHIRDRVATFSQIKTCEWCGEVYRATKPTARWCKPSCGDNHGVTKNRKKKKIREMVAEEIPFEEIAERLNVDVKWVIEWSKEEE